VAVVVTVAVAVEQVALLAVAQVEKKMVVLLVVVQEILEVAVVAEAGGTLELRQIQEVLEVQV
jgi:hypothetical protein